MEVDMMVEWEYRGQTKLPQERDGIPQHCANDLSCCALLIWSDKESFLVSAQSSYSERTYHRFEM
jgi:hypothetical protein